MANTTAMSPGTVVDDATVGTVEWSNPDNAKVSDNTYASADTNFGTGPQYADYAVKIVKSDGSIGTENKANLSISAWPTTEAYINYGSASDLWSEVWTASDINDVDFGVVISAVDSGARKTHYLKASNFGFSIPIGATINGILVSIEKKGIGYQEFYIDHIRITIYYTEPPTTTTGVSTMTGVQSITF